MSYVNQEGARLSGERISFSFGANWKKFLAGVDETRVEKAVQSFVDFTGIDSLEDVDFLDLGCGSGINSLAAISLGAKRVVSVDIDPHSVDCCKMLRDQVGLDENKWQILHGSALDPAFLKTLGQFKYVYSWGVLHHTGSMWQAIENVAACVEPGGRYHLALYNKTKTSQLWLRIKRWCNRSPKVLFPLLKYSYLGALFTKMTLKGKSPVRFVKQYNTIRGMNYFRDIDDWFGGLPYEYCDTLELNTRLQAMGFSSEKTKSTNSIGCNEFLLAKRAT